MKTEIIIKEAKLRKLIYEVLKLNKQPGSQLGWSSGFITLTSPFEVFIHNWEDFRAESTIGENNKHAEVEPQTRHRLRALLDRIRFIMPRAVSARKQAWKTKRIASDTRTLFRPGSLVVYRACFSEPQIFMVHRTKLGDGGTSNDIAQCIGYDYDGTELVRNLFDFYLYPLPDEPKVNELSIYPIEYHEFETSSGSNSEGVVDLVSNSAETLRARLEERGKRFYELCTGLVQISSCNYRGHMIVEGPIGEDLEPKNNEAVSITRHLSLVLA